MKVLLALVVLAVAGGAFWYFSQTRKEPVPPPLATEPAPLPPPVVEPIDDRPIATLIRSRVRWPIVVNLTAEQLVKVEGGESLFPIGRQFVATMLTDDGRLLGRIGERSMSVPFYDTNLLEKLEADDVKAANPAEVAGTAKPMAAQRVSERRLADLKAKFPPAEKRKAQVSIKNANGSRRSDTVEVGFPSTDVYYRYRSWVTVATVESLPAIVQKLEAQLSRDLAELRGQYGSPTNQSANSQARSSYDWLNGTMRPYLQQMKSAAAGR